MQSRTLKEKQLTEMKLLETTSELQLSLKSNEELKFELEQLNSNPGLEEDVTQLHDLLMHCQELVEENSEKSNIIIALQARLLAINEDSEKRHKMSETIQIKNKYLMQQVKDLTINYDFQRTESQRLMNKVDKNTNDAKQSALSQRQIHSLQYLNHNLTQERDDGRNKIEEYKKVVIALNARLSFLQEQKDCESERRSEISEEYLKLRQQVKTLEFEKEQGRNSYEFYKNRNDRLNTEITSHKEQIAFLTKELDSSVLERNQAINERHEVLKYNKELLRSRDEAIQNQIEITEKHEQRYKDVSLQLGKCQNDLKSSISLQALTGMFQG